MWQQLVKQLLLVSKMREEEPDLKRFFCLLVCLSYSMLCGCGLLGLRVHPELLTEESSPTTFPSVASPTPQLSPVLTPKPTPEPEPFSMLWMSDTQGYAGSNNAVLFSMFNWAASVCDAENVVALMITGDMVQDMTKTAQWENIRSADNVLPADLLRVTVGGNHDIGAGGRNPENYLQHRIDTELDPAKGFLEGLSHYVTLEAGRVRILILSIAYLREAESVEWAREVLAAHPDHFGVLLAHSYLTQTESKTYKGYTSGGVILRDELVKKSPNLRLVLCGHSRGSAYRPLLCDDDEDGKPDREVNQFLLNFQDSGPNLRGYLRLLRFFPQTDSLVISTYSPYIDRHGHPGDPLGTVFTVNVIGLGDYIID